MMSDLIKLSSNSDQSLDLNEFELFLNKLFSRNNIPYPIAKIKIKSIFIFFNANKVKQFI
jgi:hypothetical protein